MKFFKIHLPLCLLLSLVLCQNAQAQNRATISLGVNAYTLDNLPYVYRINSDGTPKIAIKYMTTGGAAFGAEYSLGPKNWSVLGRASINFADSPDSFNTKEYRSWAFMTGLNISPGESQKGFVIGPRIGFRSDNYHSNLSFMLGIGTGILLYPTDELMIGLYGEPFWDTDSYAWGGSFGIKIGYTFIQ